METIKSKLGGFKVNQPVVVKPSKGEIKQVKVDNKQNNKIHRGLQRQFEVNKQQIREQIRHDPQMMKLKANLRIKIMRYFSSPIFGPVLREAGVLPGNLTGRSLDSLKGLQDKITCCLGARRGDRVIEHVCKTALNIGEGYLCKYGYDIKGTNQILWSDREFLESIEELKIEYGVASPDPVSNICMKVLTTAFQVYCMNKAMKNMHVPPKVLPEEPPDLLEEEKKDEHLEHLDTGLL